MNNLTIDTSNEVKKTKQLTSEESFLAWVKAGRSFPDAYKATFCLAKMKYDTAQSKCDKFLEKCGPAFIEKAEKLRHAFLSNPSQSEMKKEEFINQLILDVRDPGLRSLDKVKVAGLLAEVMGWYASRQLESKHVHASIGDVLSHIKNGNINHNGII